MQDKSLTFVTAADEGFHHGLKPGLHCPLQTALWRLLGKQKKDQRLDDAKFDANDIDQLVRQVYSWSS